MYQNRKLASRTIRTDIEINLTWLTKRENLLSSCQAKLGQMYQVKQSKILWKKQKNKSIHWRKIYFICNDFDEQSLESHTEMQAYSTTLRSEQIVSIKFYIHFLPLGLLHVQVTNNITPESNIKVTRLINPLHPNIIMYILHTVLPTFSRS